ncbi:hypothetical protein [Actinoplanes aureus]|uniref:Uncharacterized protein n=1 Tax=Actinoplanes aureus TaxID=2792083 RepID=A0A931CE43_9ACTN|nr:hypothetical protein [Actinoplanes aureus]MBG0568449.1 hypothetical protein [Actinoplanes aureus]
MATRGDPPDPSLPRIRLPRDLNYQRSRKRANIDQLKTELWACFGWSHQAHIVLAQYVDDLNALAAWLAAEAEASGNPELRTAADGLLAATQNLEDLVGNLAVTAHHGANYLPMLGGR